MGMVVTSGSSRLGISHPRKFHGAEGKHAHESLAFTTWVDLTLAVQQADVIVSAKDRKRPELQDTIQANYTTLATELKTLDQDI